MSKKCFISLMTYAVFSAVMFGVAYAMSTLNVNSVWVGAGAGLGVFVGASVLGVLLPKKPAVSFFIYIAEAAAFGAAVSSLFFEFGAPPAKKAALVFASPVVWFLLFCIFSRLDVAKANAKLCVIVWALLLIGAAVACVIMMGGALGWLAIAMLAPFIVFIFGLMLAAECPSEHFCNQVFAFAVIFLVLFIIVMSFAHSGSLSDIMPEFSSDADDPFDFETE